MDGENNGKPMKTLLKWILWGENPPFLETSIYILSIYGLEPSSKVPGLIPEPFQADLEPAEWMKIGCLRQEGEVRSSDVGLMIDGDLLPSDIS